MKRFILLFQLLILSLAASAQVNWISFEELAVEFSNEKKPILLFIHTDWCKICKMQEGTVFSNDEISILINEHFYALKLNAEESKAVEFFSRRYEGATSNHYHELAEFIGKSIYELNFPTLVILNEQLEVIYKIAGFVSKEELWKWMNDLID
jgi:thioredoxin-related protein